MMGASPFDPQVLYGAIEVGGVMRSVDGGREWENLSHGMYQTDQAVDTHGILASSVSPGLVFSITGAGLFRSPDGGNHWGHVPLTPLDATGRLYTRAIQEDPADPNVIWVGAGNGFDGGLGGLYKSLDSGDNWIPVDMGVQPPSSIFCIAFDHSNPSRMACASYRGQVYISEDSWLYLGGKPLTPGSDPRLCSRLGLAPARVPGLPGRVDKLRGLLQVFVCIHRAPETGMKPRPSQQPIPR